MSDEQKGSGKQDSQTGSAASPASPGRPANAGDPGLSGQSARKRLSADDRRKALLAAAQTVFFQKGYTATRLDEIIRLGGGSRRSIYSEFGSKRGLFNALLAEVSNSIYSILDALDSEPIGTMELLQKVGVLLMNQLATSEYNFMRIAVMESLTSPEITRLYHDNGPRKIEEKVAALLEEASDRQQIGLANCRLAAKIFIGMLREEVYTRLLLLHEELPDTETVQSLVRDMVSVLLNGVSGEHVRG